jgi:hypothetical protein
LVIDIRNPSKTIVCSYTFCPRLFVPLKNATGCYLRILLPDELKQIQGFPKDYQIEGNVNEQITQIGNAVPPQLVEEILNNIIKKGTEQVEDVVARKMDIDGKEYFVTEEKVDGKQFVLSKESGDIVGLFDEVKKQFEELKIESSDDDDNND